MNRKILIILTALAITGCSTISINESQDNTKTKYENFFSYNADFPKIQLPTAIYGKLLKQNGCILYEDEDGTLATPIFPLQLTEYNKANDVITLAGKPIIFDKKVMLGGDFSTSNSNIKYTTITNPSCMKEKIILLNGSISFFDK